MKTTKQKYNISYKEEYEYFNNTNREHSISWH